MIGRQRLVVDLDELGRIHRLVDGLGDDESDIVADPANPVPGQRPIARPVKRRTVAALRAGRHRQVAETGVVPVLAGQHRQNAGGGLGLGDVDRFDAGVGVRRSQHVARHGAGKHHVADIAAFAADKPWILEPRDRLTDTPFTHCTPLSCCGRTAPYRASCHPARRASSPFRRAFADSAFGMPRRRRQGLFGCIYLTKNWALYLSEEKSGLPDLDLAVLANQ